MNSRKPLDHMQRLEVQVKGITGHRIIRSEGERIFHTEMAVWRGQAIAFHP